MEADTGGEGAAGRGGGGVEIGRRGAGAGQQWLGGGVGREADPSARL